MAIRTSTSRPAPEFRDRGLAWMLAGLIGVWFLLVLGAASRDVFVAGASRPPLPLLVAVGGPPVLFGLGYRVAPRFRAFVLGVDPRVLTAVQAWRVLGGAFLLLYAFGLLPGLFAWPAGLGDVGVGVAAVFVLHAMMTEAPTWRRRVWGLNVAGLLDFVVAIGTGVLTSNSTLGLFAGTEPRADMGALPLVLIPAFAMPLWTIAHVMSLLQLRRGAVVRSVRPRSEAA